MKPIAKKTSNQSDIMVYYAALSFDNHKDFEACNKLIRVRPGDTATSSDGKFTVMIETELRIPPGTLVIRTNKNENISVRVLSGEKHIAGVWSKEPGKSIIVNEQHNSFE